MGSGDLRILADSMTQTDAERDTATLRRMRQYRAGVIESIEGLTDGLKGNRTSRARYLAENGIDVEELQRLRAACDRLARELRWIG